MGLASAVDKHESASSSHGSEKVYENEDMEPYDDQEGFNGLMEHIGAQGVFDEWVTEKEDGDFLVSTHYNNVTWLSWHL